MASDIPKDVPEKLRDRYAERRGKNCCHLFEINAARDKEFLCSETPEPGSDFCLVHYDKQRKGTQVSRFCELFWKGLANETAAESDFSGWRFPPDFDYHFPKKFEKRVDFSGAYFDGPVNFQGFHFLHGAKFIRAHFLDNASFFSAQFHHFAHFSGATFHKDVSFQRATFRSTARFPGARFHRKAVFHGTRFENLMEFKNAKFCGCALFTKAVAHEADFEDAEFRRKVSFDGITVGRSLSLKGAKFLEDASCREAAPPPAGSFNHRIDIRLGLGEDLYRLAKQIYTNMGLYSEAGHYHYMERVEAWRAKQQRTFDAVLKRFRQMAGRFPHVLAVVGIFLLSVPFVALSMPLRLLAQTFHRAQARLERFFGMTEEESAETPAMCEPLWARTFDAAGLPAWLESWLRHGAQFVIGRLIFGYGEKPYRIVAIAGGVILVCGLLFYGFDAAGAVHIVDGNEVTDPAGLGIGNALYSSVVTFTTLGFGDLTPSGPVGKFISSFEALAGAFLMAAFLVTLARRWGRG